MSTQGHSGLSANSATTDSGATTSTTTAEGSPTVAQSSANGVRTIRVRLVVPPFGDIARIVLGLALTAFGLYLIWRIRGVIRLAAISLFFAFALYPAVDALVARMRMRRGAAIIVVYLLLVALIAAIGSIVVPSLVKEVQTLSHQSGHYAAELRRDATFRRWDDRYHITPRLVRDSQRLPQILAHLAGPLKDVTVSAASFIGQVFTVLALTFLLVLHGRKYAEMGLALTGDRQDRYRQVLIDIKDAVAGYTLGNIIISGLATIATWIVLSILGVPYSLSLGFVVGFFDLIPLIGATLGAIVVALATVPVDFPTATIVWIAFIIVWQRIEDYIVQPAVYRRSVKVNPIVTITSVLIGGALLGILGVLLAIPTAAAIQIILTAWWSHREDQHDRQDAVETA